VRRSEKCLLAGAVGLIAIGVVDVRAATLRAVIHIHSRYSHTGTESIDEIAKKAAEKGIDVFIPTDTFVAEWDYGLWPLRGLVHETVSRTSVVSVGADRYLERIREIRERYPGLIVIPGVEVAPY